MPIDRYEATVFFSDPKKVYCLRLRPLSETPGLDCQYCCRELGHEGPHEWRWRWVKSKAPAETAEPGEEKTKNSKG